MCMNEAENELNQISLKIVPLLPAHNRTFNISESTSKQSPEWITEFLLACLAVRLDLNCTDVETQYCVGFNGNQIIVFHKS